jgi:hypothetical protein
MTIQEYHSAVPFPITFICVVRAAHLHESSSLVRLEKSRFVVRTAHLLESSFLEILEDSRFV